MGSTLSSLDDREKIPDKLTKLTQIKFHLQDEEHTVRSDDVDPNTSLNFYLRNVLHMTGTKGMCYEGGCGACVVVLQNKDPITQKDVFLAVNSCLVPLFSCNGWRVYTIEGVGNPIQGYHPIQVALAKFNGTQCGFCSPGMVMTMYALYESGKLTMEEVEKSFNGNICRCTGYRSILTAFKSLCKDATVEILGEHPDIEDFHYASCRKKCSEVCPKLTKAFYIPFAKSKWVKVSTLPDLLNILIISSTSTYKLVAGNTAQGVYKNYKQDVDLYIDVNDVRELTAHEIHDNVCVLGANMTLTNTIEFLNQVANVGGQFSYLKLVANHIELIANVPIRNRGTLAGNLIIKHDHHEFPSDVFLILETVGATLTVVNTRDQEIKLSPLEFLNCDMNRQVLKTITFNGLPPQVKFQSFKIMPRAQNVHALVNAGFLFKFAQNNSLQEAILVYGNINHQFVHAKNTERLLAGKNLFDNSLLQQAYRCLSEEIKPENMPPESSPNFRKQLSIALFYKAVLSMAPNNMVSPRNVSGGTVLQRPISKGAQDYDTNKSLYPLTQALPKIEALAQTSGQAQYIEDIPDQPLQLYGALVLAKCPPNSVIKKIDASKALKKEDIVAFFSKKHIPGTNAFVYPIPPVSTAQEEIFCSGTVQYYEQPIGILIGKNLKATNEAIPLIEISFEPPNVAPLLTTRQVLKDGRKDRIDEYRIVEATRKGHDVKHVINGSFDIYHQYHFHMETQCCVIIPNENGLDVHASTQWMHLTQYAIAKMLNISLSQVTVHVRRCGGGFGGKLTRNSLISCAAALASWKLKQPVKLRLPLTANMAAIGKRFPFSADYEVGVNDKGVIQYLNSTVYNNVGSVLNGAFMEYLRLGIMSPYVSDTFTLHMNTVTTDIHSNTWMRAPGTCEGMALIESIMEHIAYTINMDPTDVRLANISIQSPLVQYINDMKSWINIAQLKSEIETFNKQNRWRKKGLSLVPMNFDILALGPHYATVSIFHGDGSVQISHGGVEIGQGINTKAAQVCAYKFKIPIEKVTVLPSNSFVAPNNVATGGSIASDGVCYAVDKACDELLKRIQPYHLDNIQWEDVIQKSFQANVNLIATAKYSPNEPGVNNYSVYGVCATEVEVDILTGRHLVTRVHINEDTGRSVNPTIDIGQVEGAFIMGMGYHTSEEIKFSWEGKVLNRNTWTYYPPIAQDIPIDFIVKFPKNNPNPLVVLKSKATGEPAICFAVSVRFAIMNAISFARTDAGSSNPKWYRIDGPASVPNIFLNSLNDSSQYTL